MAKKDQPNQPSGESPVPKDDKKAKPEPRSKKRVLHRIFSPITALFDEKDEAETERGDSASIGGVWRSLRLSEIAALFVGFLYVSGYFINSIFIRNLGIADTELVRFEYIKIGFTFTLITLAIVLLPIGAFYVSNRVRRTSGLPHYYLGQIGNSLNTTICLGFPLFLAFFITKFEWESSLPVSILGITKFRYVVITFIPLSLTGMIVLPFVERIVNSYTGGRVRTSLFRFLIEPLRFGIFGVCVYLVFRSVPQFPWMGLFISSALYFLLAGVIFVAGTTAAALWVRHIRKVRGFWPVYGLIGFGLCSLYYLAITSYVFGVYNFIPFNRGGRLPVTRAYLEITGDEKLFPEERTIGNVVVRGPAYIIENQTDTLYVASERMDRWLYEFVPIHAIRKDKVPYTYIERITDGFPRVVNPALNSPIP